MSVRKFIKKPVVIEAVRFGGTNTEEVMTFIGARAAQALCPRHDGYPGIDIMTLEGTMRASVGDWIIKGVKGEFYPCKPDIFEATYEAVEQEPIK